MFKTSPIFEANYQSTAKIVINQGGTSSGKTYSILQVLILKAIENPSATITIVGQDIPNLKSGALRDMQTIVAKSPEIQSWIKAYNASDRIFTFVNDAVMEFKSYDNGQDAKSGKRAFLFLNEVNGIDEEIFHELYMRTTHQTFMDFNPNAKFWVHDKLIGLPEVQLIISDHRHNPFVPDSIRQKIEDLKDQDIELWKVYARGLTGKVEGLVFRNWDICQGIPAQAELISYGLDFGFSNSPTAVSKIFKMDGEIYAQEILYETGLTNQDISDRFLNLGVKKTEIIVADSAEPKSIEELRRLGWRIEPAQGKEKRVMIDIMRRFKIHITANSKNFIREISSYKYKDDGSNEPIKKDDHLLDGMMYVGLNKFRITNSGKYAIR
jgi:phage terminase large subunit